MEISRTILKTMLREFWALNNEVCENATIIFLRRHDLTDDEIDDWIGIHPKDRNLKEAEKQIDNSIKETNNYFYDDEEE